MKPTTRNLVLVLALLLLMIVLLPIVIGMLMGNMMASGMMGSGMMGNMMGGMMGSGQISGWSWGLMMALASLRTIAVLGALIIGGLLLVRALQDQSPQHS